MSISSKLLGNIIEEIVCEHLEVKTEITRDSPKSNEIIYFDTIIWLTEQRTEIDGNLNFTKTLDKICHYNIVHKQEME